MTLLTKLTIVAVVEEMQNKRLNSPLMTLPGLDDPTESPAPLRYEVTDAVNRMASGDPLSVSIDVTERKGSHTNRYVFTYHLALVDVKDVIDAALLVFPGYVPSGEMLHV
ncbi:hypothetical protein Rctr85_065 [Virus Rctr85]|nr:hypothetical protein Rctr85_065 [Virus Rctr85]